MYYNIEQCAKRIAELRESKNMSITALADAVGCDRTTLSKALSGHSGLSIDNLIRISEVFDVTLDYLILGKEQFPLISDLLDEAISALDYIKSKL